MSSDASEPIHCEVIPAGGKAPQTADRVRPGLYTVQVILDRPVRAGNDVELHLRLPDGPDPIRCAGHVVWEHKRQSATQYRHGVATIDLPADARTRLARSMPNDQRSRFRVFREFVAFESFTDGELQLLLELCFSVRLQKGALFYSQGTTADELAGLFVIEKGMVRIFRRIGAGREEKLWVANAGQLFGEASLATRQVHSASIQAVNESQLIGLTPEGYRFLQTRYPTAAIKLMDLIIQTMGNRLSRTTKMLFSPSQLR